MTTNLWEGLTPFDIALNLIVIGIIAVVFIGLISDSTRRRPPKDL